MLRNKKQNNAGRALAALVAFYVFALIAVVFAAIGGSLMNGASVATAQLVAYCCALVVSAVFVVAGIAVYFLEK